MDAPHRGRAAHVRSDRPESRGWLRQLAVRLVHAGDLRVHPALARRGALRLDELRNPGHWARRLRSPAADCLPDARLGLPRAHDAHDRLEPERILALPGAVRARRRPCECARPAISRPPRSCRCWRCPPPWTARWETSTRSATRT